MMKWQRAATSHASRTVEYSATGSASAMCPVQCDGGVGYLGPPRTQKKSSRKQGLAGLLNMTPTLCIHIRNLRVRNKTELGSA